jgi:hypothetical protein
MRPYAEAFILQAMDNILPSLFKVLMPDIGLFNDFRWASPAN